MEAPTKEEIKKVEAWQEEKAFKCVNERAESEARENEGCTFMGYPLNDRFTKQALIGIASLCHSSNKHTIGLVITL